MEKPKNNELILTSGKKLDGRIVKYDTLEKIKYFKLNKKLFETNQFYEIEEKNMINILRNYNSKWVLDLRKYPSSSIMILEKKPRRYRIYKSDENKIEKFWNEKYMLNILEIFDIENPFFESNLNVKKYLFKKHYY